MRGDPRSASVDVSVPHVQKQIVEGILKFPVQKQVIVQETLESCMDLHVEIPAVHEQDIVQAIPQVPVLALIRGQTRGAPYRWSKRPA